MASSIETVEKSMCKLTITVDSAEFREALKQAYQKNKRRFAIPGFRKGKAPMNIVTNYYGEGVLYDDAIDIVMQPAYEAALKEQEIEPFSKPEVEITSVGSDKGLEFVCRFAVKPEVKLGEYLGVEAYRPPVEITEEEIDEKIERARLRASRLVPVERPVENDDTVTLDYAGSVDGELFQGGSAENYDLKIGSGSFIPGFEEQVIGHEIGENFDINVTFPEEYHSEDLAGKEAVFNITIHEIKKRELPEVDDEFIKDISEDCDTVEEYRKHIEEEEKKFKEERAQSELENNAIAKAIENAELEIPEASVRDEMDDMLNEQAQRMAAQGIRLEDYLRYLNIDAQVFRMQFREPAIERIKRALVLEAIAEKEEIEVSDEDMDKRFEDMATLYGRSADELKAGFDEENLKALKANLRVEKAAHLLRDKAVVTDVKPEPENEETEAENTEENEKEE